VGREIDVTNRPMILPTPLLAHGKILVFNSPLASLMEDNIGKLLILFLQIKKLLTYFCADRF